MARWPVLVALSFALPGLGCAGRVVPGLANAPSIQRTAPDESVHDVIANGSDACSDLGVSPLWSHYPPCWGEIPRAAKLPLPLTSYGATSSRSLVVPWLRHFYVGWPCALPSAQTGAAIASLSLEPAASSCAPP